MFRRSSRILAVVATLPLLVLALRPLDAAEYHVGPGQEYGSLEELRLATYWGSGQEMSDGAVIVLHANDSTLTGQLYIGENVSVTVQSSDPEARRTITPASGVQTRFVYMDGNSWDYDPVTGEPINRWSQIQFEGIAEISGFDSRGNGESINGGWDDGGGGVIYAWWNQFIYTQDEEGVTFKDNFSDSPGYTGGGVVYYWDAIDCDFRNSNFIDNKTTGFGGALYINASGSLVMTNVTNIVIGASDGKTSTFSGNRDQVVVDPITGVIIDEGVANSIDFTGSFGKVANLIIDTQGTGILDMRDPFRTNAGSNTVNITKIGTGTWKLGGESVVDLTAGTTIEIQEGMLSLYENASLHVRGPKDSFTLMKDAYLEINGQNEIEGVRVTFAPDSILVFNMDYYFDKGQRNPLREDHHLLYLDGTELTVRGTLVSIVFPSDVDKETRKGDYILIQGANELEQGDFILVVNGKPMASRRAAAYLDDIYKGVQDPATLVLHFDEKKNTVLVWTNGEDGNGNNHWNAADRNFYDDYVLKDHDAFLPNDTVIFGGPGSTDGGTITLDDDAIVSKDNNGYVSGTMARGMYVGDGNWTFQGASITDAYSILPDIDNEIGPNYLAALVFEGSGTLTLLNGRPNTYHDGTVISGGGEMVVRSADWLGSTEFIGEPTTGGVVQNSGYGVEFQAKGGRLTFQVGTDTDGNGILEQRIGVGAGSSGTLLIADGGLLITADANYQGYAPDKRGGAVNVEDGGKLTLIGRFLLTGNSSLEDGGAIYAGAGTTIDLNAVEDGITTVVAFRNNVAAANGGAIAIEGGTRAVERSQLISKGATYSGNVAGGRGGALYLLNTNTDISDSTFGGGTYALRNSADGEGGAVYYSNVAGSKLEADSTLFYDNWGSSGGGIHIASQTTVNANQSWFAWNEATTGSGGALAFAADKSTLNADGTAFQNNTAWQNGGAISMGTNAVIRANSGAELTDNTATNGSGGAIYALNDAIVSIKGGATIDRNKAGGSGGAIDLGNKAELSVDQATFNRNEARGGDGGAIRVGNASSISAEESYFYQNVAGYQWIGQTLLPTGTIAHGGAIASLGANGTENTLDVSLAKFSYNDATGSGGAVYAPYTTEVIANGATFTGNQAGINGGAMYLLNTESLDLKNASLIGNTAAGKGGGVYFAGDIGGEATILLGSDGTLSRFSDNTGSDGNTSIYFDVTAQTDIAINIDTVGNGIVNMADPFFVDANGNQVAISITKTGTGTWQLGGDNELGQTAIGTTIDIEEGTFLLNQNARLILTNLVDPADYLHIQSGTNLIASGNNRIETTNLQIDDGTTMWLDGSLTLNIGSNYAIGATLSGRGDFIKEDAQQLAFEGQTSAYSGNVQIIDGTFDLTGHFETTGRFDMDMGTGLHVMAVAGTPAISAKSMNIDGVDLQIAGLTLEKYEQEIIVLHTTNGIDGNFNSVTASGTKTVDYLTYSLGFLNDRKDYGGTIGLRWYSTNDELKAHGTFTLDEDASFTVNVALNDNTINLETNPPWDGKSLTKDGPGTLILAAQNGYTGTTTINDGELVLKNAYGTGAGTAKVTVEQPGSLVLDFDGTYAKSVGGKGSLIKRGSGTANLTGNNTYEGGTILEGGILGISSIKNIGSGTALFTGGILRNNAEIKNFDRNLKAGIGQNVMLDTPFDLTVTAAITDSGVSNQTGGLIKTGGGILTLTAANTYGGDTSVRAGTVKLDGSVAGDVRVSSGGAIGGGGTIAGTIASDGTLVSGGNLFINNGGAFEWFFGPTQAVSPALNVAGSVTLLDGAVFRPRTANTAFDFKQPIIGWTVMTYGGTLSGQFAEIDDRYSPFFDFELDYSLPGAIRVSGNLLSNPKTLSDSVTTSLVMANRKVYRQAFAQLNREGNYNFQSARGDNIRGQNSYQPTHSAWFTPTIRANRYASTFHTSDPYWFESYGMQAGSTVWSNRTTALGVTLGYERGLLHNHADSVRAHDYFFGIYHGQLFSDNYEVRSYLGTGFQDFTSFRSDGWHNYVAKYKGGSVEGNIELSRHYTDCGRYLLRPFVGLDFEYAHIETGNENEVGNEFRQYPRSSLTQFFAKTGVEVERRGAKVDVHGGATLRGLLIGPVRPHGNVFYPTRGAGSEQIGSKIGSSGVTMNVGFNWYLDQRRSAAFFLDYYADIFFDNDGNGAMHTGNLGVTWRF